MKKQPIEKDTIIKRVNGIQAEIVELEELGKQSIEKFSSGDGYKLAEYHLHHALEGVFHIGSHILSRLPGGQATEYAESARKLGEFAIIDKDFANTTLVKMAKYRNRIVHFYAEITPAEMHDILKTKILNLIAVSQYISQILHYQCISKYVSSSKNKLPP